MREYPDIEPPIVTVETYYRGASASVVERRITQRLEDRISQVEAIKNISSISVDGKSEITVEFILGRNLDAAANDIREAISPILATMPEEVEPPNVGKTELSAEVLMYLNLASDTAHAGTERLRRTLSGGPVLATAWYCARAHFRCGPLCVAHLVES